MLPSVPKIASGNAHGFYLNLSNFLTPYTKKSKCRIFWGPYSSPNPTLRYQRLHLKNLNVYIYISLYSLNADSIQVFPKKCSILLYLVPKTSYFGSDKEVLPTTDPYQFNPCCRSCRKGMKHKMTWFWRGNTDILLQSIARETVSLKKPLYQWIILIIIKETIINNAR